MNILVFDTETTSLEKPFCYNIGYVVYNTESKEIILKKDFVVEQVWHNLPLFESAYYHDKRPIYIDRMRAKKVMLEKFGYICMEMIRDIKKFEIAQAYAYNSPFDIKVFDFCCEWFKVSNPLDLVNVLDIRGYVHEKIAFSEPFKKFCEDFNYFTESGNYSTTAETIKRYISGETSFEEEHTALADSEIELEILQQCINYGCEWGKNYKVHRSIERQIERQFVIVDNKDKQVYNFTYTKKRTRNEITYLD